MTKIPCSVRIFFLCYRGYFRSVADSSGQRPNFVAEHQIVIEMRCEARLQMKVFLFLSADTDFQCNFKVLGFFGNLLKKTLAKEKDRRERREFRTGRSSELC